jgi:hypothetical protein
VDPLVPIASCINLCLPALVAEELPCVKEEHNSAVGFGGGAGLNGRSASFAVPLRFLVASLSPIFVVATRGSPSVGLSGTTVSMSAYAVCFLFGRRGQCLCRGCLGL